MIAGSKRVALAVLVFALGSPIGSGRLSAAEPAAPELALVPPDAAAFIHIRAKDLWNIADNEFLRRLVDKAGADALKNAAEHFPIDPAIVERVTLVMMTAKTVREPYPPVEPESTSALLLVRTAKPFDRTQLRSMIGKREKSYRSHLYYFHEEYWSALAILDEQTLLIGAEDSVVAYFDRARRPWEGVLRPALAEAQKKHYVTMGVNLPLLAKDEKLFAALPPPLQKLFSAHSVTVFLDIDKEFQISARMQYENADAGIEGEKDLKAAIAFARQALTLPMGEMEKKLEGKKKAKVPNGSFEELCENFGYLLGFGGLRRIDAILEKAPIRRQDTTVTLSLSHSKDIDLVPLFILGSAMGSGVSASRTFKSVSSVIGGGPAEKDPTQVHLEKLAEAMEKYHKENKCYPPSAIYDKHGRPLLSWRVALLPHLGEEALYKEFRLDEPWDSLHNKRLLQKLPKALNHESNNKFKTNTQVFTGASTAFPGKKGIAGSEIDPKTILLVQNQNYGIRTSSVYWTKPADLFYEDDLPVEKLFGRYGRQFRVLLKDGTYITFDKEKEEEFRKSIKRSIKKD